MSVYNDESRVSGAIESILNQSFKNFDECKNIKIIGNQQNKFNGMLDP